ncbi:D-alanine--D-alanine ligase [Ktedonosporobacter rubrisoli]|uniref:D-alanine--D-alanine ligase n=1 Tax=Ktedonosporobacter rubrisoli TaxID=2509675 RepID=A0A4P6JN74_KTERU|nr:D-alanine--D-alanine ligase family protein [Ktedonosporobacter rubrisoli]QBD76714.1 D-alanine--D-alanine ligase [Ktedonosporobacter rubrisoli]
MTIKKKRIGVVFGGRSGEHEVSLNSAASALQYLDREKYEVIPIAITEQGNWLWGVEPEKLLQARKDPALGESQADTSAVAVKAGSDAPQSLIDLQSGNPLSSVEALDVFFPILHGPHGEDGTIQGLFEMANVPYVGCGVLGSAIGMDKEIMKKIFHMAGLPLVASLTFKHHSWERNPEDVLDTIEQRLPYPCFVKPANLGSSVGVNKARDRAELERAVKLAFSYDRKIVVEQGHAVREFSCAVLGNDEPQVSVVGEVLHGSDFNSYEAKYVNHTAQFDIPATHIPDEQAQELRAMALRAYKALDLNGMARVDFFLDTDTNTYYINEVNTMPGFEKTSLYPQLWAVSGLSYPQLLDRLIQLAQERYAEKQQRRYSR